MFIGTWGYALYVGALWWYVLFRRLRFAKTTMLKIHNSYFLPCFISSLCFSLSLTLVLSFLVCVLCVFLFACFSFFPYASFQTQGTRWFLILAGALLGISAALLWSAQGCIMMSYPLEKDKGKSFSVFWAIFQFGALIGSLIALAINIKDGSLTAVATSTYIVSVSTFFGIALWSVEG